MGVGEVGVDFGNYLNPHGAIRQVTSLGRDSRNFNSLVIRIQGQLHQDDRGQAPGHVGDFPGFVPGEGAAREITFPVTEPLLEYLVAAERLLP